ncbi:MAG: rhodanese-like domain-containing protein [Planctomycetota bacterium]
MTTSLQTKPRAAEILVRALKHDRDGCVAYLITDVATRQALVVDPRLDQVEELRRMLREGGATLKLVVDTHTHADHLTGARRLAEREGAELLAHVQSKLQGQTRRVRGGDVLELGASKVQVLDAAGHTPDSLALLVGEHLFTGDSLFVGGAGRTDFMGGSAAELFDTFRRFEALPDATVVHPGHDYTNHPESTIGHEKEHNPLLAEHDRDRLVARLHVKGNPPAHMAEILRFNLGHEAESPTLAVKDLAALREAGGGPTIVDVRVPLEFGSEHIPGAKNIPLSELELRLGDFPKGEEVVLVCRTSVRATLASQTLRRHGVAARVLEGGIVGWRRAGLPLNEGKKHLGVDRQVQLIVGLSILTATILGYLVHPAFLGISAFFGAGLAFAGATGTCGLAMVLMRAPWNRGEAAQATAATCAGSVCASGGAQDDGDAAGSACAVGGAR